MQRQIETEEDFEALMREVDQRLQQGGVSIPARPIKALQEVASLLGLSSIKGGPLQTGPLPGIYKGDSLTAHIYEWMKEQYGDRLNLELLIGKTVVLLGGAPWLVPFHLTHGVYAPMMVRDLSVNTVELDLYYETESGKTKVTGLNLLSLVKDLPQAQADDLTDEQLFALSDQIIASWYFFDKLDKHAHTSELLKAARDDFITAVNKCMDERPHCGQARWAALQAAEKMLKYVFEFNGEEHPWGHDLMKIAIPAMRHGLPAFRDDFIAQVQCHPSDRYRDNQFTLSEVVGAIDTAIDIGNEVFMATQGPGVRCYFIFA